MESSTPSSIQVVLTHLSDLLKYSHEKPYELWLAVDKDVAKTNCEYTDHTIELQDVRDLEGDFDLDTSGFKFVKHVSQHLPRFEELNRETPPKKYLLETVDLVRAETGADKVIVFNWAFRKNFRGVVNVPYNFDGTNITRQYALQPAHLVHSDFSSASGRETLESHLTNNEKLQMQSSRYHARLVNVWRPLVPVVDDAPMAYCDTRSIQAEDYMPYDRIIAEGANELLYLLHRPKHRWFWLSKQTSAEPAMFVTWDSDKGNAGAVPHTSFDIPGNEHPTKTRRSIEVQLIVLKKRV